MRDLRLIGVHDDGEHLVVIDDSTGEEYRLRIDEPLRAAARRDRPRLGQLQIAIDNNVRPREVQAMIRAGATAEEVSARTGWDLDKIARFEGPVIAEREHVAERAQTVRMRGTNLAGAPETLAQRAANRLKERDVDLADVAWDARRDAEGQWTVSASFVAGGRDRTATWWFDVAGMSVVAKNDEAKWLSEVDAPAGPLPSSVHRPTAVFDVELEESRSERAHRANPDDLIASMREHSGARSRGRGGRRRARVADSGPTEDALPLETGDEAPPAARGPHPRDVAEARRTPPAVPAAEPVVEPVVDPVDEPRTTSSAQPTEVERPAAGAAAETTSAAAAEPAAAPRPTDAPTPDAPDTPATPAAQDAPDATSDSGPPAPIEAAERAETAEGAETPSSDTSTADSTAQGKGGQSKSARGRGRKGRASVPSWDDVMFGTTRD